MTEPRSSTSTLCTYLLYLWRRGSCVLCTLYTVPVQYSNDSRMPKGVYVVFVCLVCFPSIVKGKDVGIINFFFRSGKMTMIKSIIDFPKPTLLFHIVVEYRHLHRYFRYTIQCICFINCSFENVCLCFFSNAELCAHCTVLYSTVWLIL